MTRLRAFLGRRRRSAQDVIERVLHSRRRRRALARVRGLKPERILVMCHGNICRSPYAAARLEVLLRNAGKASVRSAGFIRPGRPSPDNARAAAQRRGVDLGPHRSRVVAPDDLRDSDVVLVMDEVQRQNLLVHFDVPDDRIVLLGDLDPEAIETRSIPDPEGCALEVFEACYDRLARCVDSLALQIQPRHQ